MAYLYRHIRLDKDEPFYIGIGSEKSFKRAFSKKGRNKAWTAIVNKTRYEVEILFDDLTWDQACEKEKEFIALYGRKDLREGSLVNMTNGGDGGDTSKYIDYRKRDVSRDRNGMYSKSHTEESIQKMKDSKKGGCKAWNKGLTKENSESLQKVSEKVSKYRTGKTFGPQSKETLLRRSLALKGRPQPKTFCKKCGKEGSVSNIKRWHNENCKG